MALSGVLEENSQKVPGKLLETFRHRIAKFDTEYDRRQAKVAPYNGSALSQPSVRGVF